MLSATLLSLGILTGCSGLGTASFPGASANPEQVSLGSIQGNNYGGHAPLIGAHVYVLQPSVTTASGTSSSPQYNAYAGQATSLLGAGYSGTTYSTAKNTSDPRIPTSWYYETTDSTGSFNISGDYTCTVGVPVYLYLYGGSPTYPSANNVFNVTNISSVSGTGEVTFTVSSVENAYEGESVTFTNLSSVNGFSALDGASRSIDSVNLTTSTFSVNVGAGNTTTYSSGGDGGGTATLSPTFNPSVVNLAVLGNCPSGGFTGSNAISYVFVNEVSTTAAAYAFQPFTVAANNSAIDIGTSSTNLAGLQNAAVIAKQLYDITGSNISTTYAGEGHIARFKTVAGNGIVPQANLDTVGNILAACVDSNNQSNALGNSAMSAQCTTLFTNATNTSIPTTSSGTGANAPGTAPLDIAVAAINIARHPGGPPYSYSSTGSASFMSALYGLPTGNPPFSPALTTQPNDFSIGILYNSTNNPATGSNPYAYTIGAESVAIDKIGNAWFTTQPDPGVFHGYLFEVSPAGVISNITYQTSHIYGYVTIDDGESPWAGSATSVGNYTYQHASATPAATVGTAPPAYTYAASATTSSGSYTYAGVSDASGNIFFTSNIASGDSTDYIVEFAGGATSPTVTPTTTANDLTGVNSHANGMSHGAIDATGAAYFDYNAAGTNNGTPTVTRNILSSAASASGTWPVTSATTGCTSLTDPEHLAVTRSGDVIVSDYNNGNGTVNASTSSLYYITAAGACTQLSGATLEAGLNSPFGATIDGNGYLYVTNRGGATVSVLNASGGTAATTVAVSSSTGYEPTYVSGTTLTNMLSDPLNIAAGPSGELWITDYGNNSIIEMIGLAAPTTTPLSAAAIPLSYTQGSIGYRP